MALTTENGLAAWPIFAIFAVHQASPDDEGQDSRAAV